MRNFVKIIVFSICFLISSLPLMVVLAGENFAPREIIIRFKTTPDFQIQGVTPLGLTGLSKNVEKLLQNVKAKDIRPLAVPKAVRFKNRMAGADLGRQARALEILNRTFVVHLEDSISIEEAIDRLRADPEIEICEPNYRMRFFATPNDPEFGDQWALQNTGQVGVAGQEGDLPAGTPGTVDRDIDASVAWDTQTGNNYVVVAVVDSGVDWDHSDLAANVWTNSGEIPGNGIDDDGNGFKDDVHGWDFGNDDSNPNDDCANGNPAVNANGHGTHVAGIIGAVGNNGVGVTGVGWSASLMPVKAADNSCYMLTSEVVNSILYAAQNGADVINISLGGSSSNALQTAVDAAVNSGVLIVAAAGNEDTSDSTDSYPAAYPNVISVAATDRNDQKASFSNYGDWVTLSAPGVAIKSTLPGNLYGYKSGTSMASPMVAGVAALILAQTPGVAPSDLTERLVNSCENIDAPNPTYVGLLGGGRINAAGGLVSIISVSPSYAPTDTSLTVTISGKALLQGMTIKLLKSGQASINADNVVFNSATSIQGEFDLTGAQGGRWDLELTSGSVNVVSVGGFAVTDETYGVILVNPSQSSTISLTASQGAQTFYLPAGAVSESVLLDFNVAPVFPSLNPALDPYTTTNVGVEIIPSVSPLSLALPITITLTYRLIDLADPNNEDALTLAVYNSSTGRWEPISSTVDKNAKTVTASVQHLSIFRLLQHIPSADLKKVVVFPNPFRSDLGHNRIVFDFLTAGSRVRIFDVAGSLAADLPDENNDGQIIWFVKNDNGEKIASGIYFYIVTDPDGNKEVGRVGIIR